MKKRILKNFKLLIEYYIYFLYKYYKINYYKDKICDVVRKLTKDIAITSMTFIQQSQVIHQIIINSCYNIVREVPS